MKTGVGKGSIERVPEALIGSGVLVFILGIQRRELRGGGRSAVDSNIADLGRGAALVRSGLRDAKIQDLRRGNGPSVAEDRLELAIQTCEVRRALGRGQNRNRLVPFGVGVIAHSKAGLVASGDEDHPFLVASGSGGRARKEDSLMVLERQRLNLPCCYGGGASVHWVGDVGDVGSRSGRRSSAK